MSREPDQKIDVSFENRVCLNCKKQLTGTEENLVMMTFPNSQAQDLIVTFCNSNCMLTEHLIASCYVFQRILGMPEWDNVLRNAAIELIKHQFGETSPMVREARYR